MARDGLTGKVSFESGLECSEGASYEVGEKRPFQSEETASIKSPGKGLVSWGWEKGGQGQ